MSNLLVGYPTSLKYDIQLIQKDEKENKLSLNQKNCILYRMSEKKVLHFFVTCANKVKKMSTMSVKQAKREILSWKK